MALSKKDQRTLTITLSLVMCFVVYSFGVQPVWEQYEDLNNAVEAERVKYEENQRTLKEAKSIDEGYARVEAQFPKDDPEREPSEVFNEEVVDLTESTVGVVPDYSPPTTLEIKGATGYEFLILPLRVKAKLNKVAALLQEFDRKGYLVQTATITRESDLDKDDLNLELNLGRIVKIVTEDELSGPAKPGSLKLGRGGSR